MEGKSDENLMTMFSGGDVAAFESLYKRHKGPLFRFFLRQFSQPIAEELCQDVWSNIISASRQYKSRSKFTTYLYTIARNRTIDYFRRQRVRPVVVGNQESDDEDSIEQAASSPNDEPDNHAMMDEQKEALFHCIKALPDKQREAFLLKEEAGLPLQVIGDITGTNAESIKSRLRYAIQKLKECMGNLL